MQIGELTAAHLGKIITVADSGWQVTGELETVAHVDGGTKLEVFVQGHLELNLRPNVECQLTDRPPDERDRLSALNYADRP